MSWRRASVEGVVIVGSILLAFGVQAWWDVTQERAEEQAILQRLEVEFAAAAELAAAEVVWHERAVVALESVLELTGTGSASLVPTDSVGRLVDAITVGHTWDPPSGAVASLLASGNLSIIRDVSLREALAGWPSSVADLQEIEQTVIQLTRGRLMPYLAERVSIRALDALGELSGQRGQGTFPDGLDQLLADRRFENLVQEQLWYVEGALARYDLVQNQLAEISILLGRSRTP
jgi:hypothetical protein